ncbi:MAG: peptidoglycan-binding protein [bacterium]|nr:peptidoglycan-binding protein [bacterium]
MKIKSACIVSVALFALLIPVATFAVSPQATGAPTIAELVEQIKALQSQVAQLTAELAATKKEVAIIKEELRITKTLKFGMADEEVKKLQEFLSTMPDIYPEGLVTGYFGSLTEKAVKKWQEKNEIESVGIVGPKTRAKLAEVTSSHSPGVSSSVTASVNLNATSTPSGLENRAENHPTTTPSGTVSATPAIPAEPIGQTGTTTVSATPAIPATPAPASTPPTTPPVTQFTITVTQGTNGTISPGTTSVTSGGSQTFTITPNSGYQISSVTVDGVSQGAISTYAFTNVTAAHTITASFTATPAVTLALPFFDDFNDGNTNGWAKFDMTCNYESPNWTVEDGVVFRSASLPESSALLAENLSVSDQTVETKLNGRHQSGMVIWYQDCKNYIAVVHYTDSMIFVSEVINGSGKNYAYVRPHDEYAWYTWKISADSTAGTFDLYINGTYVFTHLVSESVTNRSGLSGLVGRGPEVKYDDFSLDATRIPTPNLPTLRPVLFMEDFRAGAGYFLEGPVTAWSSSGDEGNWIFQTSVVQAGNGALYNNTLGDAAVYSRGRTSLSNGRQGAWIKTENRAAWGDYANGNVQMRISAGVLEGSEVRNFIAVSLKKDGNAAYYNPTTNTYINFDTYNDNEWVFVDTEWRSSDAKARYRVGNGTWTDWLPIAGSGNFTEFDYAGFEFNLPSGSGGVYVDNLR